MDYIQTIEMINERLAEGTATIHKVRGGKYSCFICLERCDDKALEVGYDDGRTIHRFFFDSGCLALMNYIKGVSF